MKITSVTKEKNRIPITFLLLLNCWFFVRADDLEIQLLLLNGDLKSLNIILQRKTILGLKEILEIKAEIDAEISFKKAQLEEEKRRFSQIENLETIKKNIQELWEKREAYEALEKYHAENCI